MNKKRGRPSKEERQKLKLRRALEAGAAMVEISSSKIAWDRGHDKIKVTSGKLDYRAHQVLDCAADLIAQEHWFGTVIGSWDEPNTEEPERFLVPISYRQFLNFIGDKHNLDTEDVIRIFKAVPEVILEGEVDIPYCLAEGRWLRIKQYIDNICGLAIAQEDKEFEQYRSERKLRGKGAGRRNLYSFFSSPVPMVWPSSATLCIVRVLSSKTVGFIACGLRLKNSFKPFDGKMTL